MLTNRTALKVMVDPEPTIFEHLVEKDMARIPVSAMISGQSASSDFKLNDKGVTMRFIKFKGLVPKEMTSFSM